MRKGFIRNRRRRGKKELMHLELNSLLDVLVILLVFLIKSYSTSEIELAMQKDILTPISMSQSEINRGVTVQISNKLELFIENNKITTVSDSAKWTNDQVNLIKNEFISIKNKVDRLSMQSKEAEPFSGVVNLIMDKRLDYSYVKNIMDIAADAGFQQFKFIVIES